jgi:hypothetical protein
VKANRLVLLAAGASLLVLTGCTPSSNVAARVGDATVTTDEVDFLTEVQCDALNKAAADPSQAGSAQSAATAQVRVSMVNTLIQSELNRQLAERDDLSYDKSTLRSVMEQFETVLKETPAEDRDRFRDIVESVYRGQLQVYELAQSNLAGQGVANPTQDQVDQEVAALQEKYRKSIDIEVNPAYGADDTGVPGSVDPSLSRAVSSFAKRSLEAPPGQSTDAEAQARYEDWLDALPADQRCG